LLSSTFKSMSHSLNLVLVETLTLIKGVGGMLNFS